MKKTKTKNNKMQKKLTKNPKKARFLCLFCFLLGCVLGIALYFFNIFLFKNFSILINLCIAICCFMFVFYFLISKIKFKQKQVIKK